MRNRIAWIMLAQLTGLALAGGCGNSNPAQPPVVAAGASALEQDMPACAPAQTAAVSMDSLPDHAGPRTSQYHLADGAPDRDKFFLALLKDDGATLSALLTAGADANGTRERKVSIGADGTVSFADDNQIESVPALSWAAELSVSGDTIRALIAHGANVRAKDGQGRTALIIAASNQYLAASGLEALLTAGADASARDASGADAMMHAVSTANTDQRALCLSARKLPLLQQAGVDINENATLTPLMEALYNRNLGLAKLVRALGGDTRARATVDGSTPLHEVARAADDNVAAVRWLLQRGVDVSAMDDAHQSALALFKANLAQGRCHAVSAAASGKPSANLCAAGTEQIIKLLQRHHRR